MVQVGNFSRDFASVFAEFKRRSLDKEPEVMLIMHTGNASADELILFYVLFE